MNEKSLQRLVGRALREDVGREDLTTRLTVDPESRCRATLVAKQDGVGAVKNSQPGRRG